MYKKLLYALVGVMLFSCHNSIKSSVENEKVTSAVPADSKLAKGAKDLEMSNIELAPQMMADSAANQDEVPPSPSGEPKPPKLNVATPVPVIDWNKKLIKTADIRLEVQDFKAYNKQLNESLKTYGAYIANEESNFNDGSMENNVTIKVPVQHFEEMVNSLPGDKAKVLARNIKSQDVTGDIVDTKSRLEARKVMRLKYLDFLKQSKNMEEVLQVQNEINAIQEEIESAAGRVAVLSNQAAYSTINLVYFQAGTSASNSNSFSGEIASAFKAGFGVLAGIFIFVVKIWPLMLLAAIAYVVYRRRSKIHPSTGKA